MQALEAEGIDFIVAPYEADAQMAYLAINGVVQAVIREVASALMVHCISNVPCFSYQSANGQPAIVIHQLQVQ